MNVLVSGSSGHLGEALVRTLLAKGHEVVGVDIKSSPYTTHVGSIIDQKFIKSCMTGVRVVYHAATLHKPHIVTHSMQDFIDTNISGTLTLLEEAVSSQVSSFVFTSTTSVFGDALRPPVGMPAVWVTEKLNPIPRNIYGLTKAAGEGLCRLFYRKRGLKCIVLRTSRFFPEEDDDKEKRQNYTDNNAKANEFLFRRVDLEDVVNAHLLAGEKAPEIGFGKYIISATTPFLKEDLQDLRKDAPGILSKRVPEFEEIYRRLNWKMYPGIDRVYVNDAARNELGWHPNYNFSHILNCLKQGSSPFSLLANVVGSKGYHSEVFDEGPYPVE